MTNMTDPFKAAAALQTAMWEGWFNTYRQMFSCWGHMVDTQQKLLHHAAYHRWHTEIPAGPSFTDNYGRRSHDIDPERDV